MQAADFLMQVFNRNDYTENEFDNIISAFRQVNFKKGEFMLSEGKTAHFYWFIESGFARSFVTDFEGNDITMDFYATTDIVIEWPSFFLRMPTRENIQALTDCVCWQIDFEAFQQLFHSIEKFREAGRTRLVGSYFALKRHRVSMIADDAKKRYLQLLADKPHIFQQTPLKHIATYLGITDTSLSRIRKEAAKD